MNATEKLKQLIIKSQFKCGGYDPWYSERAEYLIAHGVTVPPCRIGDKLYAICDGIDDDEATTVCELTVTEVGQKHIFFSAWTPPGDDINYSEPIDEIGKTLFFTREEAEGAIEGRSQNAEQG